MSRLRTPGTARRAIARASTLILGTALAASLAGCSSDGGSSDAAGGGAGSAGTGGGAGSSAVECPSDGAPIDPTAVIDDLEDANPSLPAIAGRSGSWWAASDMTPGGSYQPSDEIAPELLPAPRCDSRYALRFTGQGFDDWGALVGMSFAYAPDDMGVWGAIAHDGQARTGVTFWARVGDTSTHTVQFGVQARLAEPTARPCREDEPRGDGCIDTFGAPLLGIDTHWRQFRIPFTGLAQHVVDGTMDAAGLYALTFGFPPVTVFDFWLDDVAFY